MSRIQGQNRGVVTRMFLVCLLPVNVMEGQKQIHPAVRHGPSEQTTQMGSLKKARAPASLRKGPRRDARKRQTGRDRFLAVCPRNMIHEIVERDAAIKGK